MIEERPEEGIQTGEQGGDYGERSDSPEPGHPADETSPAGGVDRGTHEHPDDIRQPPDQECDETDTESPAGPSGADEA